MHFVTFFLLTTVSTVLAKVQYLGVAIAGGDFGCQIDGSCPTGSTQLPLGNDGVAQMKHFIENDSINILRLPVSWQFLVNNQLGGDLDKTNLAKYDQLMKACLSTGAYCMIDIHNFARWNGGIIGQGGPTDAQFISLWTQLASKYADTEKVVFELMNEPHDLNIKIWANTCQKAVTAIRGAGAGAQMILLPGSYFDSAATLPDDGGANQLLDIKNPDGTTDNLLLDIHKYLDEDNSGTHAECTTDNSDAFTALAQFLREKGRKGFISETGASTDASCLTAFCAQNRLINEHSDVFVGLVGWGAGSFDTSYILSLTPFKQNGVLIDNEIMSQCLVATWANPNDTGASNSEPSIGLPSVSPTSSLTSAGTGSSTKVLLTAATPATTTMPKESEQAKVNEPVITVQIASDITVLRTESIPSTLITAPGTPGDRSYSITLAKSTSTTQAPTLTPSATPSSGTCLVKNRRLIFWICVVLSSVL
ncbi:glycoside hydrolase family 5 protein [Hypoxylon fragiforme]|uniref:glycoside hydrolase family 5 protein n=1 Tax=Hypoxylon fragiforme TaxID=63214 RepID=UPI0020C64B93|nr:glycoside hydrolase family 5 protein [Hypoxylon fragiforme]KAI2612552.1 glycoside hydrolase family 5 protein [Hypoxylon fragiforme]